MSEAEDRPSWTQRRRFEFLEWKMFWEERVIRSDVEGVFGISTPQASVDLRRYRDIASENLESTARGYRPSDRFRPRFLVPSADRLLLQLRAYFAGVIRRDDIWFRDIPEIGIAPDITRDVPVECLRLILKAMRTDRAININYHSLSSSKRRVIAPHALAFDGHRWHVRAWCCENREFRDFVLSRMEDFGGLEEVKFDSSDDIEWSTFVTLQLRPHPDLSTAQQNAIAKDYGMVEGRRDVEVRAAMAFYFIRWLNLDLKVSKDISPSRLQIELQNFSDVERTVQRAQRESKLRIANRGTVDDPA